MKKAVGFLALALAFFLATWLAWWAVPVVALLWGVIRPGVRRPAASAGFAAALAWAAWLIADMVAGAGGLGVLADRLGGVMNLPGYALITLTLIFPASLAWSATALAGGLADFVAPRPGDSQ